ncbi:hypothetical protein BHE74_00006144 [Ensete ventricosum]|nr:hypothetical protein BHE74_00006144 [Ensete ventricosum]
MCLGRREEGAIVEREEKRKESCPQQKRGWGDGGRSKEGYNGAVPSCGREE